MTQPFTIASAARAFSATLGIIVALMLSACGGGSGAPNNPFAPQPTTPGPLFLLPSVATVYSNTPATLTISGGAPPYRAFTSNSTVLPISQSSDSATIVLLPTPVAADTSVIITAQDSIGQTATSNVTVRPAPLLNTLTITPNATTCGQNAICSGQTATASVTVSGSAGAGIANRQVRFDVVSGDFVIVTTNPSAPAVSTLTVTTDANGLAQVTIRANNNVFTAPAQLRATDVTTGNQVTSQFTIVQTTNGSAVLSVVPPTATITGAFNDVCSSGFRVDYYIYGGTPPYRVTSTFPDGVTLLNTTVANSGGFFEAVTNGACVNPLVFSIFDAVGLQTTATIVNQPGTLSRPTAPVVTIPALAIAPTTQGATACSNRTFAFVVTGGTLPYALFLTPQPTVTLAPTITQVATGTFTIQFPAGSAPGTYNVTAIDSSSTQKSVVATITCS